MNKPTIRYFKAEDILHIAIAGGPESRSVELSPTITVELNDNDEMIGVEILEASSFLRDAVIVETYGRPMAVILSYDEYLAYMNYKVGQEERAARFTLLRDAAGQNAAYNQLSEEEGMRLVEEARQEIAGNGFHDSE